MIRQDLQQLYDYEWEFETDEIEITIKIPYSIDSKDIKTELTETNDAITVSIPNEIPIIHGLLYAKIDSIITSISSNLYSITLSLSDCQKWPILIRDYFPNTNEIDPKSAYDLYVQKKESDYLLKSVKQGFVPALIETFSINYKSGLTREAKEVISLAADHYHDPIAQFEYGLLLLQEERTLENAYLNFSKAADQGLIPALVYKAVMLSPLSDINYHNKDAKQSVRDFEFIISKSKEPSALAFYELAKLYLTGTGVAKDTAKAQRLYLEAKKIDPHCLPLQVSQKVVGIENNKNPVSVTFMTLAGIAIGTTVVYGMYKFFKYIRSNKK